MCIANKYNKSLPNFWHSSESNTGIRMAHAHKHTDTTAAANGFVKYRNPSMSSCQQEIFITNLNFLVSNNQCIIFHRTVNRSSMNFNTDL